MIRKRRLAETGHYQPDRLNPELELPNELELLENEELLENDEPLDQDEPPLERNMELDRSRRRRAAASSAMRRRSRATIRLADANADLASRDASWLK